MIWLHTFFNWCFFVIATANGLNKNLQEILVHFSKQYSMNLFVWINDFWVWVCKKILTFSGTGLSALARETKNWTTVCCTNDLGLIASWPWRSSSRAFGTRWGRYRRWTRCRSWWWAGLPSPGWTWRYAQPRPQRAGTL